MTGDPGGGDGSARLRQQSPSALGREPELGAIEAFLDAVGRGESRSLVLEGEAGIGKTILWRHGVEDARARGLRVLVSAPSDDETQLSFSTLSDLLGGVMDEVGEDLPDPQRRALAVALLLASPDDYGPDQRTVAAATLSVLRTLAERGPVVIALDDVQWTDEPSAEALAFGVRRLGNAPVAVLATHRAGTGSPPVVTALERRLDHRLERRRVGPLTPTALHELLQDRLGTAFPHTVLERVHETSGGNPFYALELSRALAERTKGPYPERELPVPDTLLGLVRERLEGLSEPVRRLLSVVAALSDPTLARVRAAGEAGAIDEAILAGVLELGGDRLRFTHPLLESAVQAMLGPQEKRALHRRLAGVVLDPEERTGHLALAAEGPDEDVASALDEEAHRAAARGAIGAAARFAGEAARLTPSSVEAEVAARRHLDAAEYEVRNGNTAAGLAHVEPLVDSLRPGPLHAAALLRLVRLTDVSGPGIVLCRQAIAEAGEDDSLRAEAHGITAEVLMHDGDVPEAVREARAAVEAARRADDAALEIEGLGRLCHYETYTASITPGLLEQAVELERLVVRPSNNYSPREILGLRLMYSDRLDEARALLEQSLSTAAEIGDEGDRGSLLIHLTQLECRAGRLERALTHGREGAACFEQMDVEVPTSCFPIVLAAAHVGRVSEARAAAQTAAASMDGTTSELFRLLNLWALGFLELSLGNVEAANACLRGLPDGFRAMGYRNPGVRPVYADAVEARIQAGDLDCEGQIDELEAAGRSLDYPWALATSARCRGLLLAARGELEAAAAELERALLEHDRSPQPLEVGRTLLALGVVQRRVKQRAAARATLERSLELFDELGAALWAEQAAAELARIPGRGPASAELTETERRVADLVAKGLSNKEVAARLFVSVRAVEANLSKIYAKLEIRSRTELASRMARGS